MKGSSDISMRELTPAEIDMVSGGIAPAVAVAGIKFAGGAFAAGFFGKAGADLYDYLTGGC
jgi:lactobin A/cerein 7B family class IIb bacteriocin